MVHSAGPGGQSAGVNIPYLPLVFSSTRALVYQSGALVYQSGKWGEYHLSHGCVVRINQVNKLKHLEQLQSYYIAQNILAVIIILIFKE